VRLNDPMSYVYVSFILLGIGLDTTSFVVRAIKFLRREKIPNPLLFLGFFLQFIGLNGLMIQKIRTKPETTTWIWFLTPLLTLLIFLTLALILHLFIHIVLPLLLRMVCNLYYGRKLLDMTVLPAIKQERHSNKQTL